MTELQIIKKLDFFLEEKDRSIQAVRDVYNRAYYQTENGEIANYHLGLTQLLPVIRKISENTNQLNDSQSSKLDELISEINAYLLSPRDFQKVLINCICCIDLIKKQKP